jgi:hypothetical protein
MSRTRRVQLTSPEDAGLDGANAAIAQELSVKGLDAVRVRRAELGRLADQDPPDSAVPLQVPHADAPGSGTVLAPVEAPAYKPAERKETDAVSLRAEVAHRIRRHPGHAALGDADGADLPVEAGKGFQVPGGRRDLETHDQHERQPCGSTHAGNIALAHVASDDRPARVATWARTSASLQLGTTG